MSGLFDDPELMSKNAAGISAYECPAGVYFGLHCVAEEHIPRICAGAINLIQKSLKFAVKGKHIAHPGVFLVDVDAVRPSGVCSTEEEKAEAHKVANNVVAYLTTAGWPDPIIVDSGNGYHLYWRSTCAPGAPSWRYMLKWLAEKFDTPCAKVDTCVWDAPRISRMPGTLNKKGEDTCERPWRLARAVSYPASWVPPPPLEGFASEHGFSSELNFPPLNAKRPVRRRLESGDSLWNDDQPDCSGFPEFAIDEEGVLEFITEFGDHLSLAYVDSKEDCIYFHLSNALFWAPSHKPR